MPFDQSIFLFDQSIYFLKAIRIMTFSNFDEHSSPLFKKY